MSEPNAIERLRRDDDSTEEREALAAVDALYQAAARVVERHRSPKRELDALDALAAAVRRVEGQATGRQHGL